MWLLQILDISVALRGRKKVRSQSGINPNTDKHGSLFTSLLNDKFLANVNIITDCIIFHYADVIVIFQMVSLLSLCPLCSVYSRYHCVYYH